jgi:hypothetical protein
VPEEIALDTSFVTEALQRDSRMLPGILGFLDRLADLNSLLVFNRLLELELREAAFKLPLQERYPRDWRRRRHDGRLLRRARRIVDQTMAGWQELLRAYDHEVVELEVVANQFGSSWIVTDWVPTMRCMPQLLSSRLRKQLSRQIPDSLTSRPHG